MPSRPRRLPEDSVLASLSQVQEMLREEAKPEPPAPRERPVPLPVPEEVVGGVLSMAEIEASREARWRQESPAAPAALPVPARPLRLGVIAVATAVAATLALAGWWVAGRFGPDGRPGAVLTEGWTALRHAADLGASTARAEVAERELADAHAEIERLKAENARLAATPSPAIAEATPSPVAAPKPKAERARRGPLPAAARGKPVTRTKTRKPMNQTDHRLSSVIDSL